jgi:hypothetical protein
MTYSCSRAALRAAQFCEQRVGVLQVGGVEALCEPVVDFGQQAARLVAPVGIAEQACEAYRRAQLQRFSAHCLRERDRIAKVGLGEFGPSQLNP